MGFLSKIFGGGKSAPAETGTPTECGHMTLAPRWDSAENMGKTEKITHYACEACHQQFTPGEVERIRATTGL